MVRVKKILIVKTYEVWWVREDFDSQAEWEAFIPNAEEWKHMHPDHLPKDPIRVDVRYEEEEDV